MPNRDQQREMDRIARQINSLADQRYQQRLLYHQLNESGDRRGADRARREADSIQSQIDSLQAQLDQLARQPDQ